MDRFQIIFIAIVLGVAGIAVVGSLPPTGTPINISRNDYEAALAKWKGQHTASYNLILEIGPSCVICGTYTLEVRDSRPHIAAYATPIVEQGYGTKGEPTELTIDKLFAEVDLLLRTPEPKCERFPVTISWKHVVRFNEQYGYPEYIERTGRNPEGQITGSVECGRGYWYKVKAFQSR